MLDLVLPCFTFLFKILSTDFFIYFLALLIVISCILLIKSLVWGK